MDELWDPLSIDEITERFAPFDVDWWVAGGIALDLFLGWRTRAHNDIDLEIYRNDAGVLFDVFPGWDLHVVSQSDTVRWDPRTPLESDAFGVWARPNQDAPWMVEIMLADGDNETWRFRRDNEISFPRSELTRETSRGVQYCTPEVQLLFKATKGRPKDDADMVRCLHRLDSYQRSWLTTALSRSEPSHPWLDLMAQAEIGGTE